MAIVAPSGAVRFVVVENLGSARLVESGGAEGRSVLVASTRFSREDGRFTGASLVPVDVSSDEPRLLPAVALESVDARGEEVTLRDVRAELGEETIRVSGEQRVRRRADGKVLRRAPVDETHALFGAAL